METKSVTLNPDESQRVAFSYTPEIARIYQVTIDSLSGTFTATALPTDYHYIHLPSDGNLIIWDGPTMDVVEAASTLVDLLGIYHEVSPGEWIYYIPGFPTQTLFQLEYGKEYVVVIGTYPQDWEVPNP